MLITEKELKQFVDRLEKLECEKKEIQEEMREVLKEAKSRGYDSKIIKIILRERKIELHVFKEQQSLLENYREALK